jgi:hypothetical protein
MKYIVLIFAGFLISAFIFSTASCKKKDTDCIASVTCVDSVGNTLINANVLLYAAVKSATNPATTYTADITASGVTDNDGMVKFKFQFPAIYDILATATVGTRTITGSGIIKLEEGKTSEKTVTVK